MESSPLLLVSILAIYLDNLNMECFESEVLANPVSYAPTFFKLSDICSMFYWYLLFQKWLIKFCSILTNCFWWRTEVPSAYFFVTIFRFGIYFEKCEMLILADAQYPCLFKIMWPSGLSCFGEGFWEILSAK